MAASKCFLQHSSCTDLLYKVRTSKAKLMCIWLIILADFLNVIKSSKITLNSKHWIKNLKTRDTETKTRDNETLNTENEKPSFIKW